MQQLAHDIKRWGVALGFQHIGIAAAAPPSIDTARLHTWLAAGYHGDMTYLARHVHCRCQPAALLPGTQRIITARLNYSPAPQPAMADPTRAVIAAYAGGRDYHRLMRRRLQLLAERIEQQIGAFNYRPFVDSAPVLEKPLAQAAGLGWIGKHTNLINCHAGSWFFLGELYVDVPLPIDPPATNHCGNCQRCITHCPTAAIVAPYCLDARRCIAYLTIEHHGAIPESLRPLIGNRIYGCDVCQQVCPWNRRVQLNNANDAAPVAQFAQWPQWHHAELTALLAWDESQFLRHTEGSALRRLGHERWLRNLAVALGNAPTTPAVIAALTARLQHPAALVREHVQWALAQHQQRAAALDPVPIVTP